jgi:hypothetical protein
MAISLILMGNIYGISPVSSIECDQQGFSFSIDWSFFEGNLKSDIAKA